MSALFQQSPAQKAYADRQYAIELLNRCDRDVPFKPSLMTLIDMLEEELERIESDSLLKEVEAFLSRM